MTRLRICLLFGFLGWLAAPSHAREEFLRKLQNDPFLLKELAVCATCHASETGGGALNAFGSAFDDAGRTITPMLRASFPEHFGFYSTKLADGSTFHFSDPENQHVVFEREEERYLIDLAALTEKPEAIIPPAANRMSFFLTSVGKGNGGHLEGLAGADRHCQELAEAVGATDQTWRAYLSTSFLERPAVNAGDRIGTGPWFNAKGRLVARGVADLHANNGLEKMTALNEKGEIVNGRGDEPNRHVNAGDRIGTGPWFNAKGRLVARGVADLHANNGLEKMTALNEKGEIVNGRGDEPNRHDILTGSLPTGTAAVGQNCNNWTSPGDGVAMVGHHDREGGGENGTSWSSAHASRGCSQEDFRASGGDGLFYCFAIR